VPQTVPDRHPARPGHHEGRRRLPQTTHHITPTQAGHVSPSPTSTANKVTHSTPDPPNPPTGLTPLTTTHFSSVSRRRNETIGDVQFGYEITSSSGGLDFMTNGFSVSSS
ncbi:hypothetical protein ABZV38_38150, partial [Streptomyces sp. NPDC005181]